MHLKIKPAPRSILLIKPSAIGDVVHTLPILNLLRHHWPHARIAWLITPACAGILDGHPQLDEIILFDRKGFSRWWRHLPTARRFAEFLRGQRNRQFDLVLDLQGLFRSGFLALQTRAPIRVGFASAREGAPLFYTHRVPIGDPEQHAIDRYRKLLDFLGCPSSPVEYVFPTDNADRARVAQLTGDKPYALLLPGTNWPTKRWPAEHFAQLAKQLQQRHNLAAVFAGAPNERPLGEGVPGALNLCGNTNLRQLVALIERANLVIANDSGPMHIAAALGKPLIALFGPTNPVRTGPYNRPDAILKLDIPCAPCYSRHCIHQSCLKHLLPHHVLHRIEQIIQ